jgi:hypoxanthine phosphoribosyltransferase
MKITSDQALAILERAQLVHSASAVEAAVDAVASRITETLADSCPLVLCVMTGGVIFCGQLLTRLRFPLDFDYLHATRYHQETTGGALSWRAAPWIDVRGRTVLVVDDILDQGVTLKAIHDRLMQMGAARCLMAVLVEKTRPEAKPVKADFVALEAPDLYLFGAGMDVNGAWRNLPEIYAHHE